MDPRNWGDRGWVQEVPEWLGGRRQKGMHFVPPKKLHLTSSQEKIDSLVCATNDIALPPTNLFPQKVLHGRKK